ncbi:MAG: ygaP 2 [Verrucomicrobia bacterium]|jgi:rhodanese-related sulfurtransferase|nr:ygaP 2 [Verrucomicrobiota bacterium]
MNTTCDISSRNKSGLTPEQLQQQLERKEVCTVIDVREPMEFAGGHLACARLIPLGDLEKRLGEIPTDQPLVVVCRSGKRSGQAASLLQGKGFKQVRSLEGGLMAWEAAGLPLKRDANTPISLERQVRIAAGAMVLVGVLLGSLVHTGFYGLSGFVGAGLIFAGITDWCGMGMLLAKAPWNRCQTSCRR